MKLIMDKYKSFYGTLLIIIILLNFVSVCATNGSSKKNKNTNGSCTSKSGGDEETPMPSSPSRSGAPSTPSEGGAPSAPSSSPVSPPEGTSPSNSPVGGAPPAGGANSPSNSPGGGAPPAGGANPPSNSPGGGAPPAGGENSPSNPPSNSPGGGAPPAGGANPPSNSPGGGAPPAGGANPPTNPPTNSPTNPPTNPPPTDTPGGENNATILAYVLFSSTPKTTTVGRPQVKGLMTLYQPPSGNTVVTGNIGVRFDRVNGNYKFTIKDNNGTIFYDCTGRVNPLFIGQASLFSFTWNDIKLSGPYTAIGKNFVIEESNGILADGLITMEYET